MTVPQDLIERVKRSRATDNALDMEVEIATFRPDARYAAVRSNNAGTKLIYTTHEGKDETCWAWDWTLNAANRAAAVSALQSSEQSNEALSNSERTDG